MLLALVSYCDVLGHNKAFFLSGFGHLSLILVSVLTTYSFTIIRGSLPSFPSEGLYSLRPAFAGFLHIVNLLHVYSHLCK
jgi:hypothetical protein